MRRIVTVTPELIVRYVSAALVRYMIGIGSIRAMDLKIVDEYNLVTVRGDGEIGEAFWGVSRSREFASCRSYCCHAVAIPDPNTRELKLR